MADYIDPHKRCPATDAVCLCPVACRQSGSCAARPKSHGISPAPHVVIAGSPMPTVCCGEPETCSQQDRQCVYREESEKKRFAARLPANESARRKASPVWSGVFNYFPDALLAVSRVSKAGNDKHNPGQPLHWSREKSNDHLDCAARHMLTPHEIDPDSKELHLANAVWRLLAELQLAMEKQRGG